MYIEIASLTITNNATTFTVNSGEDISGISPNSILFVAGATLPVQVSYTAGAPLLVEPWAESGFTAVKARIFVGVQGLVDAIDSAKAVSDNLSTKTDEVNTIIAGQGTAATKDVTTSATDTTEGRLLKVGDYGLGTEGAPRVLDNFSDVSLGINGLYRSNANIAALTNPPPNTPYRESVGMVLNGINNTQAILHMLCNPSSGNAIWLGAKQQESDSVTWNELFHSGNLNINEFEVENGRLLGLAGVSVTDSIIRFEKPINRFAPPSGISVTGVFNILDNETGLNVLTSVVPTMSPITTERDLYLDFAASGLPTGKTYRAVASGAATITVNT